MKQRKILLSILFGLLLGGSLVGLWSAGKLSFFKKEIQDRDRKIEQLSKSIEAAEERNRLLLMNEFIVGIEKELNTDSRRNLSDVTLERIHVFNQKLKPYVRTDGKKLSAERGYLLESLTNMKIDSGSFKRIIGKTSFVGADLKESDFQNKDLSGIDLSGADLTDANLNGANLSGANLRKANLTGAEFRKARLRGAVLESAVLTGTDFTQADLRKTNLDGIQASEVIFRQADLTNSVSKYADWSGVLAEKANFEGALVFDTELDRGNFFEANLKAANLRKSVLKEADFSKADLSGVVVQEKNWLERLDDWRVTGRTEIQKNYTLKADESVKPFFKLEQK